MLVLDVGCAHSRVTGTTADHKRGGLRESIPEYQLRPALNRRSFLAANVAAASLMAGCSALPRGPAVPAQDKSQVTVLGLHDVRYWGDEVSPAMIADGLDSYKRELAAYRASGNTGPLPPAFYLAVSGGGEDGAFGAGLLVGWTEQARARNSSS